MPEGEPAAPRVESANGAITSSTGVEISRVEMVHWVANANSAGVSKKAWAKLLLQLQINSHLAAKGECVSGLSPSLLSVYRLCEALCDFLHEHEIVRDKRLAAPLLQTMTAIGDIQNGRSPSLFSPRPGQGRKRKSIASANLMAIAARALDELARIDDGQPLLAKADRVARLIKAARLPGHQTCDAKLVAGWRERLSEGPGPGVTEVALGRWHAPLPPEAGCSPDTRAKFLMDVLRKGTALHWE